ncbi:MAG TPA: sigma-70 family RNA polymerase sigma factor [Actinomycetota bacterium]|nr:sigma-70 family RNA polymerase sigma factor [Actinomycetota bacterium]
MTRNDDGWLTERFEESRRHLSAVAYRMLGSASEAEDAVQEAWLRLSRSGAAEIDNLGGWLTTVVARVCLDMLRSRRSRLEVSLDEQVGERHDVESSNPEDDVLMADSVGLAMLVVLDTLSPPERVAFVLHDMFAVPFEEIATIVGRSPDAARQLASRARRRVRAAPATGAASEIDAAPAIDAATRVRQREVVTAFLAAARGGDFDALLAVLDPDVVLRADEAAAAIGSPTLVRGARSVAETFVGRARAARPMLVDGLAGLVWSSEGRPRVVFECTVSAGAIVEISMIADPDRLAELQLAPLD